MFGNDLYSCYMVTVGPSHRCANSDLVFKSKGRAVESLNAHISVSIIKSSQVLLKNPTQHVFENLSFYCDSNPPLQTDKAWVC